MANQQLSELLLSLTQLPRETEWAEFKVGDYNPEDIGEYLSALANSAALHQKECAYIVWGVEDITHKIVGTPFRPRDCKIGNEELENWLTRLLSPRIDFEIQLPAPNFSVTENHTKVVLFAPRKLSSMDRQDKMRACYQHACLLYVSNQRMTNATLRKRLSIDEKNYAIASRIIADTIQEKLIKPRDPESSSKKLASYVPFVSVTCCCISLLLSPNSPPRLCDDGRLHSRRRIAIN